MSKTPLTAEELEQIKILKDPVLWAENYLRSPENPDDQLKLRWYQRDILRDQSKFRLLRCGRGIGKTVTFITDMLYTGFVNPNFDMLLICPTEHQVRETFDYIERMAMSSPILRASIANMTRQPFLLQFGNGSKLKGYTAGVKSGSKALSARGTSGDRIYMDECDYLDMPSIETIMPLFYRRETTRVLVSSTPTGKREYFFKWATNKSLGWKSFWYKSDVSPTWVSIDQCEKEKRPLSESSEFYYRNTFPEDVYLREIEAEFGEELDGVFKHSHLDQCIHPYRYENIQYNPGNRYTLGVDWNGEENGVQFIILEYFTKKTVLSFQDFDEEGNKYKYEFDAQGKYRVSKRVSISAKESTQRAAVDKLIELNKQYRFDWIAVDAGFGTKQIEDIKAYGKEHPGSGLDKKLIPVEFGGKTEIFDPITKQKVKKFTKPYMVGNAQNVVEMHDIIISKSEEDNDRYLIGQMRGFRVKTTAGTPDRPVYVKGNDHILDALLCALYAFDVKHSDYSFVKWAEQAAITKATPFINGQDQVKSRWDIGNPEVPRLSEHTPQPKLMDKVPSDVGYSYTLDPKSQHDDPNTQHLYRRDPVAAGGLSGPGNKSPFNINHGSKAGKKPSGRSFRGGSESPSRGFWGPSGRG